MKNYLIFEKSVFKIVDKSSQSEKNAARSAFCKRRISQDETPLHWRKCLIVWHANFILNSYLEYSSINLYKHLKTRNPKTRLIWRNWNSISIRWSPILMHSFLIMYTFLYSVHIYYPITISVKLQKEKSLQMFRIFFAAFISAQMIPYSFRRSWVFTVLKIRCAFEIQWKRKIQLFCVLTASSKLH